MTLSDSSKSILVKILMCRLCVQAVLEKTKDAHRTLSSLCLIVKLWMFRIWKFSKTLSKFQVAKLQELITWYLIDIMSLSVFLEIESELLESWLSVIQKVRAYQKAAFTWQVLKNSEKELHFNIHRMKKKRLKKWPKIQDYMKKYKNQSLLVFMGIKKLKRQ